MEAAPVQAFVSAQQDGKVLRVPPVQNRASRNGMMFRLAFQRFACQAARTTASAHGPACANVQPSGLDPIADLVRESCFDANRVALFCRSHLSVGMFKRRFLLEPWRVQLPFTMDRTYLQHTCVFLSKASSPPWQNVFAYFSCLLDTLRERWRVLEPQFLLVSCRMDRANLSDACVRMAIHFLQLV